MRRKRPDGRPGRRDLSRSPRAGSRRTRPPRETRSSPSIDAGPTWTPQLERGQTRSTKALAPVAASSVRPPRAPAPEPQVARELWLRSRLRVVLRVVDELDRAHFCCPDERTAGSLFGHDFDPVAQCRGADGPESPHPLIGVADTHQQIVLLSICERDDDFHRPRRLRPVTRQRPATSPRARAPRSAGSWRAGDRLWSRVDTLNFMTSSANSCGCRDRCGFGSAVD